MFISHNYDIIYTMIMFHIWKIYFHSKLKIKSKVQGTILLKYNPPEAVGEKQFCRPFGCLELSLHTSTQCHGYQFTLISRSKQLLVWHQNLLKVWKFIFMIPNSSTFTIVSSEFSSIRNRIWHKNLENIYNNEVTSCISWLFSHSFTAQANLPNYKLQFCAVSL